MASSTCLTWALPLGRGLSSSLMVRYLMSPHNPWSSFGKVERGDTLVVGSAFGKGGIVWNVLNIFSAANGISTVFNSSL